MSAVSQSVINIGLKPNVSNATKVSQSKPTFSVHPGNHENNVML